MAIVDFYIHQGKINLAAYVKGVTERLMPLYSDIEREAQKAEDDFWQHAMNISSTGESDPSDYVDAAVDKGVEVYKQLSYGKRQLFNLVAAGLYHIWENEVKALFLATVGQRVPNSKEIIQKANFKILTLLLAMFGYDLKAEPHYVKMDELRLVANTVKHGSGVSYDKLLQKRPDLFNTELGMLDPTPDTLEVNQDHFSEFADAINEFWNKLNLEL